MNTNRTPPSSPTSNRSSSPANATPDARGAAPQGPLDAAFDAHARAWHEASLQQLSARTHARLAQARRPGARPAPRHRAAWAVPTVFAAVAVLAIALQWSPAPQGVPPTPATAIWQAGAEGAPSELASALDENPDFYLWLASTDDPMPSTAEY